MWNYCSKSDFKSYSLWNDLGPIRLSREVWLFTAWSKLLRICTEDRTYKEFHNYFLLINVVIFFPFFLSFSRSLNWSVFLWIFAALLDYVRFLCFVVFRLHFNSNSTLEILWAKTSWEHGICFGRIVKKWFQSQQVKKFFWRRVLDRALGLRFHCKIYSYRNVRVH